MYKYYVAYVQRQVSSGNFTFPKEITYTKFRLSVIAMIRYVYIAILFFQSSFWSLPVLLVKCWVGYLMVALTTEYFHEVHNNGMSE